MEAAGIICKLVIILGIIFAICSFKGLFFSKKILNVENIDEQKELEFKAKRLDIIAGIISVTITIIGILVDLGYVQPHINQESSPPTTTTTTTTAPITDTPTSEGTEEVEETISYDDSPKIYGDIIFDFSKNTQKTEYRYSYTASVTGVHGFVMDINSINNNYKISIYDDKDELIGSKYYNDDDAHTLPILLKKGQVYLIIIEQIEGEPSGSISIKLPE